MPSVKSERYCEYLDEYVYVIVYYTIATTLGGRGAVPIGIECSVSPNGRCGKCNACPLLKEAQNDVRNMER